MKQPDFTEIYHSTFGSTPRRVDYSIRFGTPNSPHDIQFLSSLVHDATIDKDRVLLRGQRLTVPIIRECWEFGLIDREDYLEPYVSPAMLSLFPVEEYEWRFKTGDYPLQDGELMIQSVYLGEDFWGARSGFTVVVAGDSDA
ncbi:MAG: hypothetical protein GY906_35835 [bacterium]|nr:hypothetical protein [bacterium]